MYLVRGLVWNMKLFCRNLRSVTTVRCKCAFSCGSERLGSAIYLLAVVSCLSVQATGCVQAVCHQRRPTQLPIRWVNDAILYCAASTLPAPASPFLTYTSGFTRNCRLRNIPSRWSRLTGYADRHILNLSRYPLYMTYCVPQIEKQYTSTWPEKSPPCDLW